jgi:probable phosphoglycerate mutase
MTTTRLCLIRHGETAWNVEHRFQGHTDTELNAQGKLQAIQMAKALDQTNVLFDALYTSDLKRAADTADAIVKQFNMPAIVMGELRERHFGALQGLTVAQAPLLKPDLWQIHISRELDHDLQGGESISQFALRIEKALLTIQQKHIGQTILLVSHGGTLDMMYRIASGQALNTTRTVSIPNASLNWLIHDGDTWAVECWGDTRHLNGPTLEVVDL